MKCGGMLKLKIRKEIGGGLGNCKLQARQTSGNVVLQALLTLLSSVAKQNKTIKRPYCTVTTEHSKILKHCSSE